MLTQAAEWTPSTLLALGARNVTRLLPFNMVVTNVPGPQMPMYMLGARMLEAYPHVPLVDRLGLGIALLSYNGQALLGLQRGLRPGARPAGVRGRDRDAFRELRQLANASPVQVGTTISPPAGMAAAPKGNGQAAQLSR